jgi:hypothetical protein
MDNVANHLTATEHTKLIERIAAEVMAQSDLTAEVWDSGGNIETILVSNPQFTSAVYLFGTANETWDGDAFDDADAISNGMPNEAAGLSTNCPSSSGDAAAIAAAIVTAVTVR